MKSKIYIFSYVIAFLFLLFSCGNQATGSVSGTVSGGPAGSTVLVIATNQAENLYDTDNIVTRAEGTLDAGGTFSYSIAEVIVGRKYVIALVDVDGDGEYTEPGSYVGAAGVSFPAQLIPGSANVDIIEGENSFDISCGEYLGAGFRTVQLQITANSNEVRNNPAYLYIDTDKNPAGYTERYDTLFLGSSTISHTFTNVPDGSYYAYAHFDVNGNDFVDAGDWFGYHGSSTYESPPPSPTLHLGIIDLGQQSDTASEVQ